ncbi:hypothetical protein [Cochleicola gelatinilyticus]|uniref:Uncharacterized protein n=1 Tax=Cochleicola gelatinilyticus TaxID=1763537 RepID=A0A167IK83_9FLAO|nr:hypothetical protein [Cochleicola gelatinilyticus]OAB79740.1 hypothetical protein ULVI_03065 [Cochleicola gelatinilyticus]
MSAKGTIDLMLYRPIKDGKKFNSLFPSSTCKATILSNGDTYYSMDLIKEYIDKYHQQTKKVASVLNKRTLPQTVKSIYDFLYWNIQYKADGSDQQLRSPACSWHDRKNGIDCKSYSIFAGCILRSLGIKFLIRKIKQPGMLPNQFTHVYIVVPNNQATGDLNKGHLVIDATKRINTEPDYIDKYDIPMQHIGLAAAGSTTISQNTDFYGRSQPVKTDVKEAFENFLSFLKDVGVHPKMICAARNYATTFFNRGIDPYFKILKEGFQIEKQIFPYTYNPKNELPRPFKSPLYLASRKAKEAPTRQRSGLNGEGDLEEQLGEEITQIAGDLLKGDFFNSTIGAVLGNGWDLTCWGASNNPKKSKEEVAIDAPAFFKASGLTNQITTQSVNNFIKLTTLYIKHREFGSTNNDLASCTRKGNVAGLAAMKGYRDTIMDAVTRLLNENNGSISKITDTNLSSYSIPLPSGYHNGSLYPHGSITGVSIPVYSVVSPVPIAVPPQTGGLSTDVINQPTTGSNNPGTSNPQNTGGNTNNGPTKPQNPKHQFTTVGANSKVNKASLNPLLIVGLIAGTWYYNKNKKTTQKRLS